MVHKDEAPLKCPLCPKTFKNKQRLKLHEDIHTDTIYTCTVCGLILNTKRTLASHMAVHSDARNFKCEFCGNEFKRAKSLKAHMLLHTGKKMYSCNFCPKEFASGSNLRAHKRSVHRKELDEEERKAQEKPHKMVPTLNELRAQLQISQ